MLQSERHQPLLYRQLQFVFWFEKNDAQVNEEKRQIREENMSISNELFSNNVENFKEDLRAECSGGFFATRAFFLFLCKDFENSFFL